MELPISVPLKRPIDHEGETYSRLDFDEPSLEDQIKYAELEQTFAEIPTNVDGLGVVRFWISRLAGVPLAVAGKVKASDMEEVERALDAILKPDPGDEDGDPSGNETPAK